MFKRISVWGDRYFQDDANVFHHYLCREIAFSERVSADFAFNAALMLNLNFEIDFFCSVTKFA
jgi:hypothetical protein